MRAMRRDVSFCLNESSCRERENEPIRPRCDPVGEEEFQCLFVAEQKTSMVSPEKGNGDPE